MKYVVPILAFILGGALGIAFTVWYIFKSWK